MTTHDVQHDAWFSRRQGRANCGALVTRAEDAGRQTPTCDRCLALRQEDEATLAALTAESEALAPKPVPFTQYLRPDGRTRPVTISCPPDIAALAAELREAGCRFAIEELMTGHVSMTIEDDDVDELGALAHEICANGPAVPVAVDRLVREAYAQKHLKGKS